MKIDIKIPGQILDYVDTKEHLLDLFNYITNLQAELQEANDNADWWHNRFKAVQQENERLKENNQAMQEEMARVWEENERLKEELFKSVNNTNKSIELTEDYKSRCEKAIEYINCNKQKTICAYGDNEDDDFEICLWEEDIDNLLNILQNGSDSQ